MLDRRRLRVGGGRSGARAAVRFVAGKGSGAGTCLTGGAGAVRGPMRLEARTGAGRAGGRSASLALD
eukprot:822939-Amorphochlora_amoeboformis.AAC.1